MKRSWYAALPGLAIFAATLMAAAREGQPRPELLWKIAVRGSAAGLLTIGSNRCGWLRGEGMLSFRELSSGRELGTTAQAPGKWRYTALPGTAVMAGFEDKRVAAWDSSDGKVLVKAGCRSDVTALFTLNPQTLVVADETQLSGFSLTNGSKLWERPRDASRARVFRSAHTLGADRVLTLWLNRSMTAITALILDAATGEIKSTTTLGVPVNYVHGEGDQEPFKLLIHGPFLLGGKAFVASAGISCLDLATGKQEWAVKVQAKNRGIFDREVYRAAAGLDVPDPALLPAVPVRLEAGTLVLHDIKGMFHGIDPATGKLRWRSIKLGRVRRLAVTGATARVLTADGVFILDLDTGSVRAFHEQGSLTDALFSGGDCLLAAGDELLVLNATNLKVRERIPFHKAGRSGDILRLEATSAPGEVLVYGEQALVRYAPATKTMRWRTAWPARCDSVSARNANGRLHVLAARSGDPDVLYSLDPASGRLLSVLEAGPGTWVLPERGLALRAEKNGSPVKADSARELACYRISGKE